MIYYIDQKSIISTRAVQYCTGAFKFAVIFVEDSQGNILCDFVSLNLGALASRSEYIKFSNCYVIVWLPLLYNSPLDQSFHGILYQACRFGTKSFGCNVLKPHLNELDPNCEPPKRDQSLPHHFYFIIRLNSVEILIFKI